MYNMAGDPFSSHPYPALKNIVPLTFYCAACEKDLRTADRSAHERGKKHVEKVAEQNPPANNVGNRGWNIDGTRGVDGSSGRGCHKLVF